MMQHAHVSHIEASLRTSITTCVCCTSLSLFLGHVLLRSLASLDSTHAGQLHKKPYLLPRSIQFAQYLRSILFNPLPIHISIIVNHRNGSTIGKVAEGHCGIIQFAESELIFSALCTALICFDPFWSYCVSLSHWYPVPPRCRMVS